MVIHTDTHTNTADISTEIQSTSIELDRLAESIIRSLGHAQAIRSEMETKWETIGRPFTQ